MNYPGLPNEIVATTADAPLHVHGLKGASVAIVDDQESARSALSQIIRGIDPGISTYVFGTGKEALDWIERNEPDLVIADNRMTGMTGAQFTSALRKGRHPHVPVIVVSTAEGREIRYEALEAGAVDVLVKPIDPIEVRTRCRNLLLLTHQYRLVKNYSLLQDRKLSRLHAMFRTHVGYAV